MPPAIYGTGLLYGGGSLYGRIGSGLSAAQDATVRETALKLSVIDERSNRWEIFTGNPTPPIDTFKSLGMDATRASYYSYRSHAAAMQLPNGNIIRVRIGDGSLTDFGIYTQTITDPTVAAQWNAWTLLYSGTHYGIGIAANGNTVHVYASKADGLYRDNVLKWAKTDIAWIAPVIGTFDALFVTSVRQDPYSPDGFRTMDTYYTPDIMSSVPVRDPVNYRWFDSNITAILTDDGTVLRYQSIPRYDPRSYNNGDSITVSKMPSIADNTPSAPRIIRGLAGEVGHNILRNLFVTQKLADGYYYLFYAETHKDDQNIVTENAGSAAHWQRSKDGIHWSEPVSTGFGTGVAIVQGGGYYWFPTWDQVYRRPDSAVTYDISNYVPHVNFEIPRDNQEASGEATVANPSGINAALTTLSDRRLVIEVGLRTDAGLYEYVQYNDWWIKRVIKEIDGETNRLKIQFGDIWQRLSAALRDTFNFIGQLKWRDWSSGNRNKAFNYFFVTDTAPVEQTNSLKTKGIVLYTGWKGQNGTAEAHFSGVSGNPAIILRYIDAANYQKIEKRGSTLYYISRVAGVETTVDSAACAADTTPTLKIIFRWEHYDAYVDGALVLSGYFDDQPNVRPGYVGFSGTGYVVSGFTLDDWEPPLSAEELIRTALAMGDYHDVITGSTSSEELAIIWGPQTDAPTPADGLRQALEATKWDLIWFDGRIQVGSFKDASVVKTIDNRIIRTDYVDEANRHINLASVDGNEDTWMETDVVDTRARDRQINSYFDLPELTDADSTRNRALEEIRKGKMGRTPGGQTPLYFDLWRMDVVNWIDNSGEAHNVRIEGLSAEIEQGMQPSQRETFDTSLLDA